MSLDLWRRPCRLYNNQLNENLINYYTLCGPVVEALVLSFFLSDSMENEMWNRLTRTNAIVMPYSGNSIRIVIGRCAHSSSQNGVTMTMHELELEQILIPSGMSLTLYASFNNFVSWTHRTLQMTPEMVRRAVLAGNDTKSKMTNGREGSRERNWNIS